MSDLALAPRPLADSLDDLISRHGARAVAKAALVALFRRREPPVSQDLDRLNDRLLRDIGLPPRPPALPSGSLLY